MGTHWIFVEKTTPNQPAAIGDQMLGMTETTLTLRNPWITDSVFMGKLYTAMSVATAIVSYPLAFSLKIIDPQLIDFALFGGFLLTPSVFLPFLLYRIYLIKNLTAFHLNRHTRKIYAKRGKKLFTFDWDKICGGFFMRREFGGSSFSDSYALALAPRREDGSLHLIDGFWIDSNQPTESSFLHVAEVWEYIRQFMENGPAKLPPASPPSWLHYPLHAICLTPAQAWRHYVPWRTGEPGEMQGKKNWQLPFWAVLFPYNFTLALCWYVVCRVFNIKAAPPPPEAFEEAPPKPSKRKRT